MEHSDKVVYDREEFTRYLADRVEDKVDIGRMIGFVEGAFVLQNDVGRPAYIFEVDPSIAVGDIEYVQRAMQSIGACAVLVPTGMLRYAGRVTPESMGVENIRSIASRTESAI